MIFQLVLDFPENFVVNLSQSEKLLYDLKMISKKAIEKLEKMLSLNNKLDENQIRITWILTNYIMWRISL